MTNLEAGGSTITPGFCKLLRPLWKSRTVWGVNASWNKVGDSCRVWLMWLSLVKGMERKKPGEKLYFFWGRKSSAAVGFLWVYLWLGCNLWSLAFVRCLPNTYQSPPVCVPVFCSTPTVWGNLGDSRRPGQRGPGSLTHKPSILALPQHLFYLLNTHPQSPKHWQHIHLYTLMIVQSNLLFYSKSFLS